MTSGSANNDVKEEENHASGSAHPAGVKEVDWSVFHSNPDTDGDTGGFGSYSDFFSGLGDNAGVVAGNTGENQNVGLNVVSADQVNESVNLDSSSSYMQGQDSFDYNAATEQAVGGEDQNSSQYWENLYPGWKFDVNTGQWYQVSSYDSGANVQDNSASDWTVSDGKSEVSYLQQASPSVAGTVAESGTTESVTNWNQGYQVNEATENEANWKRQVPQASDGSGVVTDWNQVSQSSDGGGVTTDWNQVSQSSDGGGVATEWNQASEVNNGYPSHMVFDPQYPGWYYDTIAMEWRSLETYTASTQSNVQGESQLNQNGLMSSADFSHNDGQSTYGEYGQNENSRSIGYGNGGHDNNWSGSFGNYNQQNSNMWQTENVAKSEPVPEYREIQSFKNHYSQEISAISHASPQMPAQYEGTVSHHGKSDQSQVNFSAIAGSQGFVAGGSFNQQFNQPMIQQNEQKRLSSDYYGSQNAVNYSPQAFQNTQQFPYAPTAGRSSAGRPPHALVTFGFGGKLIVMKDNNSLSSSSFGSQNPNGGSISVLNLMDVMSERTDSSSLATGACDYIQTLYRNPFPGPLVGGNAGIKELNKWIDERIANSELPDMDYKKGEVLKLLLSLLKIACQHYGKLRSFGTEKEDAPETAVARLFASVKSNSSQFSQYGTVSQCLQQLPSEGQLRTTASEVQSLLVSGRKKEALQCAVEGQLWGPALVLAAQLGDQFYAETVKQMALRQLTAGSPLRTLCLLIAGQPADVFNADSTGQSGMPITANVAQQPAQFGASVMLDDWEENLAVITANRTKSDELVLVHLGDCLWKERSDIVAAHICYLVAEANVEPYSDSARLCLLGADHWKFPRTYASPEAIQRTEIYEYSKVIGNPQFTLPPFQPYKLVYAHMLAEVGRTSDALKYCQALSKSLKTGRAPEIDTLKQLVSSFEERIKTHQEGGFATNLAPGKLLGKMLNLIDSTAHRVVGGLPPPVPSTRSGSPQGSEHLYQSAGPRVSTSQSTMAMSSLMPSASMEPISEWAADNSRMTMHNRSVSEPDFGRTPRQDQVDSSKEASSSNTPGNSSAAAGRSRFGRFTFGSQLLQKTVGLVLKPRQGRQAKLGETNKFYYDEKLKRWVEEGAEPPAEEPVLAPPPTNAAFQSTAPDYNLKSALKTEGSMSNGSPDMKSPTSADNGSGIPPLPPTTNQFSARSRMGVRSRYVDTFNKGGGNPTNLFQSPSVPSLKPATGNAKFFVPTPMSPVEQTADNYSNEQQTSGNSENHSISAVNGSFQSPAPPSTMPMQRYPSMDSISNKGVRTAGPSPLSGQSRRTASWSGGISDAFNPNKSEVKPLGEVLGMPPSSFMPSDANLTHSSMNGGSFSDDLHEVEL